MEKYHLVKGKPIGKTQTKQEWIKEHMNDYGVDINREFGNNKGLETCKKNVEWMISNGWLKIRIRVKAK